MPKNASTVAKPSASKSAAHEVDELIRRGRRQGHLSLPELRTAFEQASVAPTRARSSLRELSDDGVKLSEQPGDDPAREPAVADHPEVEHADVTHAKTALGEAQFRA